MKIEQSTYKDIFAIALTYGEYCIKILPYEGGKMASLKKNGKEYLSQRTGDKYRKLTLKGSYVESECSGFDDMFPTIDPWFNGQREYYDHGEVCRIPWDYDIRDNELHMQVKSPFNDYILSKSYTVDNERLIITYSVENISDRPLPVIWCAHLMLNAVDKQIIKLPDGHYEADMMFSSSKSLEEAFRIKNGDSVLKSDFSRYDSYKFYIKQKVQGNISYGDINIETENAPYLGVWINNGSFNDMKNCALEVCTGGYDTPGNAINKGHEVFINPGEHKEWKLKIYVEE